jgi:Ca-activated chloride channel family protein
VSFRFVNPIALFLVLLPVLWWLTIRVLPVLRPPQVTFRYSDAGLLEGLPTSWRVRWRFLPNVFRLCAWMLLVVSFARPQSGNQQQVIRGEGIDIVLGLDISGSMRALDIAPSRLEGAKAQIAEFIAGRRFDRVGLVVFAADAFHYVPLTLDYDLLRRMVGEIQLITDYGLENQTAIGTGIASSANMLRDSDAASRIIIVLTDGANNAGGVNPLDAARAAAALDIRVYTIGMGRTGLVNTLNEQGQVVPQQSDLDEPTLQAIADITGGLYFRVEDRLGLQLVYEQIDALERSEVEEQVYTRWREQAMPFMIVALGLLVGEWILRVWVFVGVS